MRFFRRITALDGTAEWQIPMLDRRERIGMPMRAPLLPAVGADGAYDVWGRGRAPRAHMEAEVSFLLAASDPVAFAAAVSAMLQGTGGERARKLWRWDADAQSGERWTLCRLLERPAIEREPGMAHHAHITLRLALPDPAFYEPLSAAWLAANGYTAATLTAAQVPELIAPDLTFAVFTITASPFTFMLRNAGDVETRRVLFLLQSQAAGGITNPQVRNDTTRQSWQLALTGATAQTWASIYAAPGLGRAQRSDDGGANWTDVTIGLSLGTLQGVVMELAPGDNAMAYLDSGTPNLRLYVAWWHAYRD